MGHPSDAAVPVFAASQAALIQLYLFFRRIKKGKGEGQRCLWPQAGVCHHTGVQGLVGQEG